MVHFKKVGDWTVNEHLPSRITVIFMFEKKAEGTGLPSDTPTPNTTCPHPSRTHIFDIIDNAKKKN